MALVFGGDESDYVSYRMDISSFIFKQRSLSLTSLLLMVSDSS